MIMIFNKSLAILTIIQCSFIHLTLINSPITTENLSTNKKLNCWWLLMIFNKIMNYFNQSFKVFLFTLFTHPLNKTHLFTNKKIKMLMIFNKSLAILTIIQSSFILLILINSTIIKQNSCNKKINKMLMIFNKIMKYFNQSFLVVVFTFEFLVK